MGIDITLELLYGFKLPLSEAFNLKLLSEDIMEDDDWQLIGEPEYRNEIISRHVLSSSLKYFLENDEWNIYILINENEEERQQEGHGQYQKYSKGFFYLYNRKEDLHVGGLPSFATGLIEPYVSENVDFGWCAYKGWSTYRVHWIFKKLLVNIYFSLEK